ncbi:MAG: NAD(P)-dependent alcohol dehydrogenase [Candidatus Eisenbacteria sp.]|nr:NAD(P)-dependent alcohol dehydrogenase [Candidatus Eisenbacteria bacterium]
MNAVVMERYGTPDVLQLRDVAKPTPKANEVLVRVHAASVNDWDWGLLQGTPFVNRMISGLFTPKVQIIGGDIAGRVEAVGKDVKAFEPGDEVYGDLCMSGFGAFAEYACAPEACLAHKPTRMTFEQAAAIPQAGMLAVQGLIDVGRIQSGQKLLLNGAGGGVGTFALQVAKLYETEVTVVDKPGKLEMLRAMGADYLIDCLKEDFTKGGKCYDLILDVKTNRSPFAYARALNPNGTYVTVGGNTLRLIQALVLGPPMSRICTKHVRIVTLKPNKDLAYMNELFEAGKLVPVIDGPYKLADVPEAFRLFGTGDHKGKIIVTVG